jgi:hypothetical protein
MTSIKSLIEQTRQAAIAETEKQIADWLIPVLIKGYHDVTEIELAIRSGSYKPRGET